MGIHVFPILNPLPPPFPSHPSGSYQWTGPWAPCDCQLISQCKDRPHFIHSSSHGHWDYFHFLVIISVAMDIRIQFVCVYIVFHLGSIYLQYLMYLRVILLGSMETLCLVLWGTTRLFSKAGEIFYTPTSSVWKFRFLHMFANTCYCSVLLTRAS